MSPPVPLLAFDAVKTQPLSIETIWSSDVLKQLFYDFLCSQHDEELFEFLEAVEHYENGTLTAHHVMRLYVHERSRKEINLSCEARKSFLRDDPLSLENEQRPKVFSKLKKRVMIQLQQEKLPYFLKSQQYKKYLETSHSARKMKWLLGEESVIPSSDTSTLLPPSSSSSSSSTNSLGNGGLKKRSKSFRKVLKSPRFLFQGLGRSSGAINLLNATNDENQWL